MAPLRIVYVHGIHQHPPEPAYHAEWDAALKRQALLPDIETKMVYWADIRAGITDEMVREAKKRAQKRGQHTIARIQAKANSRIGYIIALFMHLLDPAIRRITRDLLTDVYLYFYGVHGRDDIRDTILDRMDALMRAERPDVVIAHSWGSVIAYDYFINRSFEGELPVLITMGSPLGQGYVREHIGSSLYPDNVHRWLNVFDGMDPATWPDRHIADDILGARGERLIRDVEIPRLYDEDGQRDPHSWYGYLMCDAVQNELFRIATVNALAHKAQRGEHADPAQHPQEQ